MKKTGFFVLLSSMIAIGLAGLLTGCVAMPIKEYRPPVKTNEIFIGEIKIFKDIKVGMSGIKNIGTPAVNDPYYQEVAREYNVNLKTKLERNRFTVVEQATPRSLIIKTKIGDYPPPLGGWLGIMAMGYVGAQVEIYYNNELILTFEEGVNTGLGFQAKSQIKRHIVPRIVKKLSERFL